MIIGSLRADVLLPGDVGSLKQKRSAVRPILAELRRKFEVSVAETGDHDRHGRTEIGVGLVASDASHARAVLEAIERTLAGRPEIELLSTRTRVWDDEDE